MADLDLFAVCAPGLEALALREVQALGLQARAVPGGVELRGTLETAARLNLWLRTASRVLARLGEVKATSFPELVKRAQALPFGLAVRSGQPVAWRVTCRKSRLYHSGAVAERLHAALEARLGRPSAQAKAAAEDDEGEGPQLLLARFDHDVCTVSADASGALLHRRGLRAAVSQAPLRETLAAALLLHAGYEGGPLADPLCGGGTLALEAALIARRRAPGLARGFALLGWPGLDRAAWARLLDEARANERGPSPIEASDADPRAAAAARDNAARAGLDEIAVAVRPLAELPPAPGAGLVATNPPYGRRVDARDAGLAQLWRQLGERQRAARPGWRLAVICPEERLARLTGARFGEGVRTANGGLRVELLAVR